VTDRLAFMATMIGYMANYAGPRVGELVRGGTVAGRTRLKFPSVFGTIVVERVLDSATLALALLSIPLIFGDELGRVRRMLVEPVRTFAAGLATWAWVLVGLAGIVILAAGIWLLLPVLRGQRTEDGEHTAAGRIIFAFRDGFVTLARTGRPVAITLLTVMIWALYGLVAWIPFVMLDMAGPYGIGILDGWGVMLLGAIGVVIPSPGGIGSYHYITTESLEILFGMPQTTAATYALLVHTGQMLLYIAVGFASILVLGERISIGSKDRIPDHPSRDSSR
jgi:hypothetical protein